MNGAVTFKTGMLRGLSPPGPDKPLTGADFSGRDGAPFALYNQSMKIPIPIAELKSRLEERLKPVRERFAPYKKVFAVVLAFPMALPAAIITALQHPAAPARATVAAVEPRLTLKPAEERVLVLHEYAASATEVLTPLRPRLDVQAAVYKCSTEIGVLCNKVKDRPWASVKCLREHEDSLRPACRKALRPPTDDDYYEN